MLKKMMWGLSFSALVLLADALVGCDRGPGGPMATTGPLPTMVEYVLQVDGLTLKFAYPDSWVIQRGEDVVLAVELSGWVGEPTAGGPLSVEIRLPGKDRPELGDTLEEFASLLRLRTLRVPLSFKVISASEIMAAKLGELDALSFSLDSSLESSTIIRREQFEVADLKSHWLTVIYTGEADLFEKYQPIFDAISASFKVEQSS